MPSTILDNLHSIIEVGLMPSKTAIAFFSLFVTVCVATLLRHPYMGILLYEVQYFANPPARWWYGDLPDLRYSFTIVLVTFIGFLLRFNQSRKNRLFEVPQFKWLFIMSLLVLATHIWAFDPQIHFILSIKYFKIIIFAILAYKLIDTPNKMEALLGIYVTGIFYIAYLAKELGRTGHGRLEGIGGADTLEGNGTAAVVVTAVPIIIFYILFGKTRWIRICALGMLPFVLNCLVLINSRGAFLALVVSGLYFAANVFKEKGYSAVKKKIIAGMVGGIALFIYLADETFWLRMNTLIGYGEGDETNRIFFWMKTFDMLKDYPMGAGGYGYTLLSGQYLPSEWLSRAGYRAVHSIWFQVLSEYGYQGMFVFFGYVISCFTFLTKVRKNLRNTEQFYPLFQSFALESAFIALLISICFIDFFYNELMHWLPFYIAAFGNIYLIRDKVQTREGA